MIRLEWFVLFIRGGMLHRTLPLWWRRHPAAASDLLPTGCTTHAHPISATRQRFPAETATRFSNTEMDRVVGSASPGLL